MGQRGLLSVWQRIFRRQCAEIGQALTMLLDNPDAGLSDVAICTRPDIQQKRK